MTTTDGDTARTRSAACWPPAHVCTSHPRGSRVLRTSLSASGSSSTTTALRRRGSSPSSTQEGGSSRVTAARRCSPLTGLTRYSVAPRAKPRPRSGSTLTTTTGTWAVSRIALEGGQHLPAVHPGQVDVEHDGHGVLGAHEVEALLAAGGHDGAQTGGAQVQLDELGRARVVLDDDDRRPGQIVHVMVARLRLRRGGRGRLRDREAEGAALARGARQPQTATVQLDDAAAQGQPETGALARRGRAFALLEGVEDAVLVGRLDADARVGHGDVDLVALAPRTYGDAASVGRELHGVAQQVEHHLLEPQLVGRDRAEVAVRLEAQPYAVQRRPLAHQRQCLADDVVHGERRDVELHPAGLDLGQVEDVAEQGEQVASGRVDVSQVVVLALVELCRPDEPDRSARRLSVLLSTIRSVLDPDKATYLTTTSPPTTTPCGSCASTSRSTSSCSCARPPRADGCWPTATTRRRRPC